MPVAIAVSSRLSELALAPSNNFNVTVPLYFSGAVHLIVYVSPAFTLSVAEVGTLIGSKSALGSAADTAETKARTAAEMNE